MTNTIFTKIDLTTLSSPDTVITTSSYASLTPDPSEIKSVQIGTLVTDISNGTFYNGYNLLFQYRKSKISENYFIMLDSYIFYCEHRFNL